MTIIAKLSAWQPEGDGIEAAVVAAWLAYNGHPIENAEQVLHPMRVEAFLNARSSEDGASKRSLDTYKSMFKVIAERMVSFAPSADPIAKPSHAAPNGDEPDTAVYSVDECTVLFESARIARSHKRRRHLTSMLLLAEAGLKGGLELGCVVPDDVRGSGGSVNVAVWAAPLETRGPSPRRTVTIADESKAEQLLTCVGLGNDKYVLGGSEKASQRNRRSGELVADCGQWAVPLDLKRLRRTGMGVRVAGATDDFRSLMSWIGASSLDELVELLRPALDEQLEKGDR